MVKDKWINKLLELVELELRDDTEECVDDAAELLKAVEKVKCLLGTDPNVIVLHIKFIQDDKPGEYLVSPVGEGMTEDEVAAVIDDLYSLEEEESMMFEWARRMLEA